MRAQEAVTVRAWLRPGAEEALSALLHTVSADVAANPLVPFAAFGTVHFARFVILPEARDLEGRVIPPSLVYAANVDGRGDVHLRELVREAAVGVDRIFEQCEGYPEAADRDDRSRFDYLARRRIRTQAFYVNTLGRTAQQVREEALLRESLEQELDALPAAALADGEAVRAHLQNRVRTEPRLAFAQRPAGRPPLRSRIRERAAFFGGLVLLLLLLPLLLLVLPAFLILLRFHETRDARAMGRLRLAAEERFELRLHEDRVVQNQLSAVGNVKPGAFRLFTLRVLLAGVDFAARHVYRSGDLGTAKLLGLHGVDTIHFAQWIVLDGGRRVLFFSNYDGSLVSYMDDFVNKVAWGLNAVFSNGMHYPATRWLVLDGAKDEQQFKAFLHRHQLPTQAWYTAHARYTARNLSNNAAIRRALFARRPAAELLARL